MQFLVLGPVAVRDERGGPVKLGGLRQRAVLAALLARRGRTVSVEGLIDDVWHEEDPPAHPERTLRTYVSRLRSALGESERIARHGGGYRLEVRDEEFDVGRCEKLAREGRALLAADNADAASARLRQALALWRGEPLADLGADVPLVGWMRPRLQELRFSVLEARIDADLAAGSYDQLIGELRELIARYPLRERLVEKLVLALYGAGRQAEALDVFREARERLVNELGVEPSRELINLHEAVLRHDVASVTPKPAASSEAPGARLPRSLTSFVGRQAERVAITSLLDETSLVTLTGVGGSGKTRLAVEIARRRLDEHPDGVWFVPLASVDDPSSVAQAVADAVGLRAVGSDAEKMLVGRLQDAAAVLVIDNCEHLRSAAARLVEGLLRRCERLRVVATSREPLGVAGEQVWRLPPLRTPPPDADAVPAEQLAAYEAVRLFEERARSADHRFALDENTLPAAARICRRLAGIPLAIELAASRARTLSCEDIADRLDGSLRLLRSSSPTKEARHRTLQATLEWSYRLLDGDERMLLRRLGVFRSAFPLEGAEAVAVDHDEMRTGDVIDRLDHLVACSLVEAEPRAPSNIRYRLLEPVRLFAAERLEHEDDAVAVRATHAQWWIERMREVNARVRASLDPAEVPVGVAVELDDLRAALRWTVATGRAELAQRLVGTSYLTWWAYGRMREGIAWTRQALGLPGEVSDAVQATALAGLALMELHYEPEPARAHAEQALAIFETLPEDDRPVSMLDARNALVHVEATAGDLDTGQRLARQLIETGKRADDDFTRGLAGTALALAAIRRGDLHGAYGMLEDLLDDAEQRGQRFGAIASRFHLGMAALRLGRYARARQHLEAVIDSKRRTGADPFGHAHTYVRELEALSRACLGQGDLSAARRYATEGISAARELGSEEHVQQFARLRERIEQPDAAG